MKEIIYLDTGVLHSYIAQHYDGLPTETSNERGEEVRDTNEQEQGYKSGTSIEARLKSGKFEVPGFLKTPEGDLKFTWQPGEIISEKAVMSQTESGKEIISKQLHDNALEVFLENNEFYAIDYPEIQGKLIQCTSEFKIIDFSYLKSMIQPDALLEFMYKEQEDKLSEIKKQIDYNKNNQEKNKLKALYTQFSNEFSNQKKDLKDQFNFMAKAINYLNDILPNESFMVLGKSLAPLKSEFLRETSKELMFKYGGSNSSIQVTMIGKVTNRIDSIEMPDLSINPFFEFPKILNSVLNPLGVINKGDLIVSPIAIYFE